MVNFGVHHLPLPGAAPAKKNRGSLPPLPPPPVRRAGRGGDTRGAAPPRLSQRMRAILSNPRPVRLSR